jgi:prepilin-type N-terminal cleavage/methylation domain-containing protein
MRRASVLHARGGLTLIELLVALVIATISGAALIQAMLAQGRSADNNEAWRVSRTVSRGSLNRLLADLRAAEADGALDGLTAGGTDVTVRVPFAIGVACTTTYPIVVSGLPPNMSRWNAAVGRFGGFAWRDQTTGRYRYRTAILHSTTLTDPGNAASCASPALTPPILAVPASGAGGVPGRVIQVSASSMPSGTRTVGMPVILFQLVRYQFKPSLVVDSLWGLFRSVRRNDGLWEEEELAAPFDSSTARFRFYVTGSDVPQSAVPSPRSDARGLELNLDGMSETIPRGSSTRKRLPVRTSIFFKNRHD